jgi:ElaB/YqjD/DUF883 family membrane-anchored ribosome-binding protein
MAVGPFRSGLISPVSHPDKLNQSRNGGVLPSREAIWRQAMAESSQQGGRAAELKEQVGQQVKKVADRVEEYANVAADRIRNTGPGEVAGNLKGAVDRSTREQPMTTLVLAAALGFVLGALWKS